MATKTVGGKITGLLALTCEAQVDLEIGDNVMLTGPYEVELADGTAPVLGRVSVANKGRVGATFPDHITPGDCTVEARGWYVAKCVSGAAITAGQYVYNDPDNDGKKVLGLDSTPAEFANLAAATTYVTLMNHVIGIALTSADSADDDIDVLYT